MSKLKILKIDSNVYRKIKNIDKEDSIDRNVNKVLNMVKEEMPDVKFSSETKSVSLYPETLERLDNSKITMGESRDTVLMRALILYDEMTNFENDLIPFKLTSTINPNLKLTGGLNDKEVVPDISLKRKYVVHKGREREDLTAEFRKWINILDWEEIKDLVLTNPDSHKTYVRDHYRLEINF